MATRRVNALRGLLAASALLALLLIATAAWSYVSIRGNVADLARGRGTFLCDVLRDDLESLTPGPPDLKGLLSRNQNLGISWIGRVNPDGDVLDEAGTRPAAWLMYTGDEFQIVGNLAVVTMPPPHQDPAPKGGVARERPARSADGAPPLCLSDDPRCGSDGQLEPEPRLELAYALTAANDLLHRSEEALGVAIAGAVLLMGGTGISWRALKRAEAAEASLQRHRQLAELGQVFAVLAHEVRNPLSAVKGHAQLLAELLPTEDRLHARATRVVVEAERLERLMEDLLSFAREARLDRVETNPVALATRVAEDLDPARVSVDAIGNPGLWLIDPNRVVQVLSNLVTNALQAGPEGSPVLVGVEVADGALIYTVRDLGPGLDPAEMERIFEPFVTLRARGTGLGLAVARRFVSLHGGTLIGTNHPEGGALFIARFPNQV